MGVLKHLTAWQWQYLKKQRKMSHQWVINSLNSQIPQDFLLKWKSTVPLNHSRSLPEDKDLLQRLWFVDEKDAKTLQAK
jgi:hypothetical protein